MTYHMLSDAPFDATQNTPAAAMRNLDALARLALWADTDRYPTNDSFGNGKGLNIYKRDRMRRLFGISPDARVDMVRYYELIEQLAVYGNVAIRDLAEALHVSTDQVRAASKRVAELMEREAVHHMRGAKTAVQMRTFTRAYGLSLAKEGAKWLVRDDGIVVVFARNLAEAGARLHLYLLVREFMAGLNEVVRADYDAEQAKANEEDFEEQAAAFREREAGNSLPPVESIGCHHDTADCKCVLSDQEYEKIEDEAIAKMATPEPFPGSTDEPHVEIKPSLLARAQELADEARCPAYIVSYPGMGLAITCTDNIKEGERVVAKVEPTPTPATIHDFQQASIGAQDAANLNQEPYGVYRRTEGGQRWIVYCTIRNAGSGKEWELLGEFHPNIFPTPDQLLVGAMREAYKLVDDSALVAMIEGFEKLGHQGVRSLMEKHGYNVEQALMNTAAGIEAARRLLAERKAEAPYIKLGAVATAALKVMDGFSLSLGGVAPTSGFMVALEGFEEQVNLPYPVDLRIQGYLDRQDVRNELVDGKYFGGWVDNQILFLDVSVNFDNEADAIAAARLWNQKAYYDCAAQVSKDTPPVVAAYELASVIPGHFYRVEVNENTVGYIQRISGLSGAYWVAMPFILSRLHVENPSMGSMRWTENPTRYTSKELAAAKVAQEAR